MRYLRLTFIILNHNRQRNGGLALSNQVGTFNPKLVHPGLLQTLQGHGLVGADVFVAGLKDLLVMFLLLYKVADDGAAAIITRWFPGQGDGVLGPLCVVELLRVAGGSCIT